EDSVNGGGILKFKYDKVTISHGGGAAQLLPKFQGKVNETTVNIGDKLDFNLTTTGVNLGTAITQSIAKVTRTLAAPKIDMTLTPKNQTIYDLNKNADYPYSYSLGGITLNNKGPSIPKDCTFHWDFDPNLAITMVSFPGEAGVKYYAAKVTTTKGRTLTAANKTAVAGTATVRGTFYGSNDFGMAADEYILSMDVKIESLPIVSYTTPYTFSHNMYSGRFQNGKTGDATLTIFDADGTTELAKATDRSTIGFFQTGAGTVTTTVSKTLGGVSNASFYPNEKLYFRGDYLAGNQVKSILDIVDPKIIISLPEGLDININSIEAQSVAGKKTGWFGLELESIKSQTINSIEWKTYIFKSKNKYDMIANATYGDLTSRVAKEKILIRFDAVAASNCAAYPGINFNDVIQFDIGDEVVNATSATDYRKRDTTNRAGKGASHYLVGTDSGSFAVVQKKAFIVNLGIRTVGSGLDFGTYNGLKDSIVSVSAEKKAEIELKYENTSDTAYEIGTEIYFPIPKKTNNYSNFFQDKELLDPVNNKDNTSFLWTAYLEDEISLEKFDTFYSVNAVTNAASPTQPVGDIGTWVPVTGAWLTKTQLDAAGKTLADVVMVKFIAKEQLISGIKGSSTFRISIDGAAKIGDINYWRSFQKGWRDNMGQGTWTYGAVLAAEPSKAGIKGQIFVDKNADGKFDKGDGDSEYSSGKITALLTEDSNLIAPHVITIENDGTFLSLNPNGTIFHLIEGDYTLTFTNTDDTMFSVKGAQASVYPNYYMDVPASGITGRAKAEYKFKVDENSSTKAQAVGLGVLSLLNIYFDTQGGSANPDGINQFHGGTYGFPISGIWPTSAPTKKGYTFESWNTKANGTGVKISTGSKVTAIEDHTLFAQWKKSYDENGFDIDGYDKDGFDKDGYDRDGYDRDGYNKEGYDRDGNKKTELDPETGDSSFLFYYFILAIISAAGVFAVSRKNC
ncbi:MAG: InlB B-repeat-containing protein, partial [Anaerovoracaceae bacterium]